MEELIKKLLIEMTASVEGEDPSRPDLKKTPARVAKSLKFLTGGSSIDPDKILEGALFDHEGDGPVLVKDLAFYSMCEHHLLPFFGSATIAYVPDGKLVGLSKLPRVVDAFSRRLQVQERLTRQIADTLFNSLKPISLGVRLEARHLCMEMRGVMKPGSIITTFELRGGFRDTPEGFYNML